MDDELRRAIDSDPIAIMDQRDAGRGDLCMEVADELDGHAAYLRQPMDVTAACKRCRSKTSWSRRELVRVRR